VFRIEHADHETGQIVRSRRDEDGSYCNLLRAEIKLQGARQHPWSIEI
jgi:hypothetical protein